jgi:hypothetical protein
MCGWVATSATILFFWIILVEGIASMKMTLNHDIMKISHRLTKFYKAHVIYSNICPKKKNWQKENSTFPFFYVRGRVEWS